MQATYSPWDRTQGLICPICRTPLVRRGTDGGHGSLVCGGERQHCYDIARQGYVHLCPQHSGGGDSAKAVLARAAFLGAGYYEAARQLLCSLTEQTVGGGLVADAGCGEGYYTSAVAQRLGERGEVIGFDLSRDAVATAAKAAKAAGLSLRYAVASVFALPLASGCADGVLNIFAPCAEQEYTRVLRTGGKLLLVSAGERHLLGLKRAIYDDVHVNDRRADLPTQLRLVEQTTLERTICVEGREHIDALFSMTPYYWRTPRAAAERLARIERLETEIAFDFLVYQKD